ncbi:MAG: hypothetical protein CR966_00495 [Pseudomonadales bacterium]|nr:MAG: hypothetical protein CR966_00495 [Pseudomonadales bacterium]
MLKQFSLACLGLVACQSTGGMGGKLTEQQQLQQANQAKSELQQSLNKQLRRSFSYHSKTHFSNEGRLQALKNATPEQLANTNDVKKYCEYTHDNAYVALLRQAEQAGDDIEDSQYDAQRKALMTDYQACKKCKKPTSAMPIFLLH